MKFRCEIMNSRLNFAPKLRSNYYFNDLFRFVCDCAKVAEKKGFKVFGIQYYAECWGNRTFTKESLPQEKPMDCLSGDLSTTCPSTGPDRVCTGKVWRNFVFSLEKVCTFLEHLQFVSSLMDV